MTEKTLSFNEITAIKRLHDVIPIALYETLHHDIDQAKALCDGLLASLVELGLGDDTDNPAAILCRYQIGELQRLQNTLTTTGAALISAQRFAELAQSCGLVCETHARIYTTAGHNEWDAGNHIFVMKAV